MPAPAANDPVMLSDDVKLHADNVQLITAPPWNIKFASPAT